MFMGAIGGGALIWRFRHDDHSNHGNWHEYSEYHDASLKAEIEENVKKAERRKRDAAEIRKEIISQQVEALRELGVEVDISSSATASELSRIVAKAEEDVKKRLEYNLSEELEKDKEKIKNIDKAIRRINELQLGQTEK